MVQQYTNILYGQMKNVMKAPKYLLFKLFCKQAYERGLTFCYLMFYGKITKG